jgi:hypothetical protein
LPLEKQHGRATKAENQKPKTQTGKRKPKTENPNFRKRKQLFETRKMQYAIFPYIQTRIKLHPAERDSALDARS